VRWRIFFAFGSVLSTTEARRASDQIPACDCSRNETHASQFEESQGFSTQDARIYAAHMFRAAHFPASNGIQTRFESRPGTRHHPAVSTPGSPAHRRRQNVRSIEGSRCCRSSARELSKRLPRISERTWPAIESVLRSRQCWAISIRNYPAGRFRSVAVFTRARPADYPLGRQRKRQQQPPMLAFLLPELNLLVLRERTLVANHRDFFLHHRTNLTNRLDDLPGDNHLTIN
jgi:hypothetical protein